MNIDDAIHQDRLIRVIDKYIALNKRFVDDPGFEPAPLVRALIEVLVVCRSKNLVNFGMLLIVTSDFWANSTNDEKEQLSEFLLKNEPTRHFIATLSAAATDPSRN